MNSKIHKIMKIYIMKTDKEVPERPRERATAILHLSELKYAPATFHNFCAEYAKSDEHYESKKYKQNFMKSVRELSIRTQGVPGLLNHHVVNNIFQP